MNNAKPSLLPDVSLALPRARSNWIDEIQVSNRVVLVIQLGHRICARYFVYLVGYVFGSLASGPLFFSVRAFGYHG